MSQDSHSQEPPPVSDNTPNNGPSDGHSETGVTPSTPQQHQPTNSSSGDDTVQGFDPLRRRTEALERILLGTDSTLSQATGTRRLRVGTRLPHGPYFRSLLNRSIISRRDSDRAILIPFRTRSSVSALNLSQDSTRALSNFLTSNFNDDRNATRSDGNANRTGIPRPLLNVSSIFMELTYSATDANGVHFLKSPEGHKRRLELHAANTMIILKHYLPIKSHKLHQFRCNMRTKRNDQFTFQDIIRNPLEALDPLQNKCNTRIVVLIHDDATGKWNSSFTSHLMNSLVKRHVSPTCLTFQSEEFLNTLIEQLSDDLRVFPKNANPGDPKFNLKAKRYLIMNTLAKIFEHWHIPLLVLDSCVLKLIDCEQVTQFCARFEVTVITADVSVTIGGVKQKRSEAKRIRRQIHKILIQDNLDRIRNKIKLMSKMSPSEHHTDCGKAFLKSVSPTLLSDDCRRIVLSVHERINASLKQHSFSTDVDADSIPQLSLLEDEILADIEKTDAFQCKNETCKPKSNLSTKTCKDGFKENILRTDDFLSDDDSSEKCSNKCTFATNALNGHERISDLLFHELNQRFRINGPLRYQPKTADSGPYCTQLTDVEKQLLFSILQEVSCFETLKDIRNELKDSKKDLEGRLYGYNPDFSNLIASAEEFLHGKASCLEPCKEEMQFYKMPVSLVFSDAEVKYLKSRPPQYITGQYDSPGQIIKMVMEESTKLFIDAVVGTACGSKKLALPRRNKTKVVIVVEDNNEALELLTVALWFYDKIPVATFQPKHYYNTSDFLLSLDACRFYFNAYSTRLNKKEEERLFDRWLGVGMNGIIKSQQSKIILIDFPRPGMNLQHSKTILTKRLQVEETLNNIKSFFITRPSRKEDNLSTVEAVLDEVQKVLDPREKLLFRKARRTYLDLKLYKQIEQKSRQDLKALRDWGLPEPDNEHELWDKLRNSELVINPVVSVTDAEDVGDSVQASSAVQVVSSKESCFEDTSETESGLADESEQERKSYSEDGQYLSECEESLESVNGGDDSVVEPPHQENAAPIMFTSEQPRSASSHLGYEGARMELSLGDDEPSLGPKLHKGSTESLNFKECVHKETWGIDSESTMELESPHQDEGNDDESKTYLRERLSDIMRPQEQESISLDCCPESGDGDTVAVDTKRLSLIEYDASEAFTKLEFTLPPESQQQSPNNESPRSHTTGEKTELETVQEVAEVARPVNGSSTVTKRLPKLCLAFIAKFTKSVSKVLHKKPMRKFPEKLFVRTKEDMAEANQGSVPLENVEASSTDCVKESNVEDVGEQICAGKSTSSKLSRNKWFRNILTHFKVKKSQKSTQTS